MPRPLMSPEGLSEYLGEIPIQTIYRWHHRGDGPRVIKVGRHLRYRPEDVDHWLEERANKQAVS
jgi:excisionase family DNA binding protein